jgi:hypothetical protein
MLPLPDRDTVLSELLRDTATPLNPPKVAVVPPGTSKLPVIKKEIISRMTVGLKNNIGISLDPQNY